MTQLLFFAYKIDKDFSPCLRNAIPAKYSHAHVKPLITPLRRRGGCFYFNFNIAPSPPSMLSSDFISNVADIFPDNDVILYRDIFLCNLFAVDTDTATSE